MNWQPTASTENLKARAAKLREIREFFHARDVYEVETPIMASAPVTDPFLTALETKCSLYPAKTFYLQTSPEYAMKRLLAAGSGSIYSLGKAFRDDECGSLHNPEFTLLEWYRIGFDDSQLIDEIDALLQTILKTKPLQRLSYKEAFEHYLGINPHKADMRLLQAICLDRFGEINGLVPNKDTYLQLLMSDVIEPQLGQEAPTVITDFPVSQAALARTRTVDGLEVAARFEVYVKGIELANGYHELKDPAIQKQRFAADLSKRVEEGKPQVPVDEKLLAALESGFPDCAGVALGVDRLVMLALKADRIEDILSFNLKNI
ncbi:MAG: EF-P lysine aminoacylase EpmA [Gammaproteobacteria bacterium]|nr:EF-P lysine aminoacylase EpmA [Gammaproteobacteria bacterium]